MRRPGRTAAAALAGLAACNLGLAASGPVWDCRGLFFTLWPAAFLCLAALVRAAPQAWEGRRCLALVLGLGALLRLAFAAVFPADSDVLRYLWEGAAQLAGFNPYLLPPSAPELDGLAQGGLAGLRAGLNHPDWTSIYPPLAQLLFRAVAWVWADPLAFKWLCAALELAGVLGLAGVLAQRGLHPSRLALWALNPLALVYGAGEGHLDAAVAGGLGLGLWCFAAGRDRWGFLALGCAASLKWTALPLLPFFLTRSNWRKAWPALVPGLAFLAFLDAGSGIFASLAEFGLGMRHNDSLAALLRLGLGPAAPLAAAGLLALLLALAFLLEPDPSRGAFLAAGAVLLCLPVLHPWYLLLVTPFLPLFASRAWLWLHAAAAAVYLFPDALARGGPLAQLPRLAEYLPFFGLLAWSLWRGGDLAPPRFAAARSLAVVIPVLDEEDNLAACLASVRRAAPGAEIVVADGGSRDRTVELARAAGARVVDAPAGRGGQIAAGAAACAADAVLVLHADCRLAAGAGTRALAVLNAAPDAAGGAFAMRFDRPGPGGALVARLNTLRARLSGVSFGDQAQFFRREALEKAGGFPAMALMEDVELCLRLKAVGRLLLLSPGVAASGRRWRGRGFGRAFGDALRLFARYLLERRLGCADPTGRRYYRAYYGRDPGRAG